MRAQYCASISDLIQSQTIIACNLISVRKKVKAPVYSVRVSKPVAIRLRV